MEKTIRVDLNMSDNSTSDDNQNVFDKNSNKRDRKKSDDKRRGKKDSDQEETLILNVTPRSENVEKNQTPAAKINTKETVLSEAPASKKRSIFDLDDDDDDDDAFQKKTPKNVRRTESGQQAKKIKSRRSSRIYERKRSSLNQSRTDDEIDEEGKKRRSMITEPSKKKTQRPSTSSQVHQTDNTDDSQETADEEELPETEVQRKARVAARSRSAHNLKILKILNQGSEAQLKSLSRIGPKTATMLHQYRKLHGKFTSIMDLEDMPGWTPRVFEQFVKANNIISD